MYLVLLYFVLNFAGFFVFYAIWELLRKPPPYDYTTIPGLKCEDFTGTQEEIVHPPGQLIAKRSQSEGNLDVIRKFESTKEFFVWLHKTFGPLASFYWSSRYVVSVSNIELLKALKSYAASRMGVNPFALASVLLGDANAWNYEKDDHATPLSIEHEDWLFVNYDPTDPDPTKNFATHSERGKMSHPGDDDELRPVVIAFTTQVDLNAHPVPAYVPIVVNLQLISKVGASSLKEEDYKWILDAQVPY